MRARMKRRTLIRRVTILVTLVVISVSLAVGIYIASTAGNSALDSKIGQPVSTEDVTTLYRNSLQPYGPAPPTDMVKLVENATGPLYTVGGKPIVVYIGAEFCPYCAVQRWSLIMALMRFGNFTNLTYMTSSAAESDLATFTFVGSSYRSSYVVFQPFENEDRNRGALQAIPSNYSTEWRLYGSIYPFMNFGNKYLIPTSTMIFGSLQGKNWTQVLNEINSGDAFGTQIRQSANLLTSLICKLTGEQPSSVCTAYPIESTASGLQAPVQTSEAFVPTVSRNQYPAP
jgi:hypothetical protein